MKTLFLAIAAGGLALSPVAASAQTYQETRLLKTMDDADLEAVLDAMDAAWESSPREDDTDLYQVTFANGLKAYAWYRVCEDGQCRGLVLVAQFSRPSGYDSDAALDDKLRGFNDTAPAAKAYRGTDGNVGLQSYIISDGGIMMGNMKAQIEVFRDSGGSYQNYISQ